MGLFNWLKGKQSRAGIENPQVPITGTMILDRTGTGANTQFGYVTPNVALTMSAVYACIRVISETMASLPLVLYQATDKGKRRATEHYLYYKLHDRPNDRMTSFTWREVMQVGELLKGNSYHYIEQTNGGKVANLLPIEPNEVKIGIRNGQKYYIWERQPSIEIPDNQMLHFLGLSYDGIMGLSPLQYARNAITLGIAAEEYGSRFFAQGSSPSGVLETPNKLTDDIAKRLRESWEAAYTGLKGAHKVPILEEGMKWTAVSVPNEDAQFLQIRKFQVEEIARLYRVPMHKINSLDKATFSNIEEQNIEFTTDTIRPKCVKIEQELNYKLLTEAERLAGYFFEFDLNGLLRGNQEARYKAYQIGRNCGFLCVDDIREMENMNKLDNGQGEIYITPLNYQDAENLTKPEDLKEEQEETPADTEDLQDRAARAVSTAATITIGDTLTRMAYKELEAVKRATGRPETFGTFLADFYAKHERQLAEALSPAFTTAATAYASMTGADTGAVQDTAVNASEIMARNYCKGAMAALAALGADKAKETDWQGKPADIAKREADKLEHILGGYRASRTTGI